MPYRGFERMAAAEGQRSQREKLRIAQGLFGNARPIEGVTWPD